MIRTAVIAGCAVGLLAGCASQPVTSLESRDDLGTLEKDERRFWAMADDADAALRRSGLLYGDPELDAYMKGVLDSIFPEFAGVTKIQVIQNSEANAFAMTNGSIYINTGMLARLESEAELAAILGHEGAHFTERHVIQNVRKQKDMSVFANVVGLAAGAGGALASSLFAVSSMSGLSQALESEADVEGLKRMSDAGYAASAAARPFERLAAELEARAISEPLFFRSHPKLAARAVNLDKLAGDSVGGDSHAERYLDLTVEARVAALETAVRAKNHDFLIYFLSDPDRLRNFPERAGYFLAEAYRARNAPGDRERAVSEYRRLIAEKPEFAPPYSALGKLEMRAGNDAEAIRLFDRYLELAPLADDRAYVSRYRDRLRDGQAQ